MSILGKVRCMLGKHDPNRRKIVKSDKTYSTVCNVCGKTLWRHDRNDWRTRRPPVYSAF